jgi:hypothetical protein
VEVMEATVMEIVEVGVAPSIGPNCCPGTAIPNRLVWSNAGITMSPTCFVELLIGNGIGRNEQLEKIASLIIWSRTV